MKRLCCGDCGAWFNLDSTFCPECGTLGEGQLPRRQAECYLQPAVSTWWAAVRRGARWVNLGPLGYLSAVVDSAVRLATRTPPWTPAWLSGRVTFSRLLPVQIQGLDLGRLERESGWLEHEGFTHQADFVLPEEGTCSFYRLLGRPGECTWALLTAPSPSAPDAQEWTWTFHSLLQGNQALATVAMESLPGGGGLDVQAVAGSPFDRLAAHRQGLLRAGQARACQGLPAVGQFYRHFQLLTARRLERGQFVLARSEWYRSQCLHHPWAPAVRECSFCRAPQCDTCGLYEEGVFGCALCASLKLTGPASRPAGPSAARKTAGALLDLALAALLCWLAQNLLLAALLLPLTIVLVTLLGSPGRQLVGLRLQREDGGKPDFLQLWLLAWTGSEPLSGCVARGN